MTNFFNNNDTLRSLVSAVAALMISATFLVAAAGPAVAAPNGVNNGANNGANNGENNVVNNGVSNGANNSVNFIPNSNIVRGE